MRWFGDKWNAAICVPEQRNEIPVGRACKLCYHLFSMDSVGVQFLFYEEKATAWRMDDFHLECFFRMLGITKHEARNIGERLARDTPPQKPFFKNDSKPKEPKVMATSEDSALYFQDRKELFTALNPVRENLERSLHNIRSLLEDPNYDEDYKVLEARLPKTRMVELSISAARVYDVVLADFIAYPIPPKKEGE